MHPKHSGTDPPAEQPNYIRRWRLFLAVELGLVGAVVGLVYLGVWLRSPPAWDWVVWPVSLLATWLVFTLPICVLYLIGRPPVMSLAPLLDSPDVRAFKKELRTRSDLDDESFIARYYANTGMPKDIPIRLRKLCSEQLDKRLLRVQPADLVPNINDELDLADLIGAIEKEFAISVSDEDVEAMDWSFASLVQLVKRKRDGLQVR